VGGGEEKMVEPRQERRGLKDIPIERERGRDGDGTTKLVIAAGPLAVERTRARQR
jgi:hypothetical protein